jgi:DNA-binding phage protein
VIENVVAHDFMSAETKQQEAVQELLNHGFRVMHSGSELIILMKPKYASCQHIAQVNKDGSVNTKPLSEFLSEVLE